MKILNNYNNNYNTNFCARLITKDSGLAPEKREAVEKEFEYLTKDYPDDTFTLKKNTMIANIHNGDLTANFVEVLKNTTSRDYYNRINKKENSSVASEFAKKYNALRKVSDMYKDGLEFAENFKEKYGIDMGDSYRTLEMYQTYSGVHSIMGQILDALREARLEYKNNTDCFNDTRETIAYSSTMPEDKDAWIKYKDIKIPFSLY